MTALVSVVVGLAAGGIAYASIPDPSGVIHGCYKTVGGSLRVIDTDITGCRLGETALNWNQTGPTGPTGPQGPGATTFETTVAEGGSATLATTANGLTITATCGNVTPNLDLRINPTTGPSSLQISGLVTADFVEPTPHRFPLDGNRTTGAFVNGSTLVDFSGVARDVKAGPFARLDIHAEWGSRRARTGG